jgi:hypothetical protein
MREEEVLMTIANRLDAVRDRPIRELRVAFQQAALPPGAVLAVSLTAGPSQRVRFLFAHYREGRTWPSSLQLDEPKRDEVRGDGKRVVGRFQSSEETTPLVEVLDETELRDLPATFTLELKGGLPSLSKLIANGSSFDVTILPEQEVKDLDLRVTALYGAKARATLFRSDHRLLERQLLEGADLSSLRSAIEREALLGADPRCAELESIEARQRRERAQALMSAPEAGLSPDERRIVATLRHGEAMQLVTRAFGSAPPPPAERRQLHASAIEACEAVLRLLTPLVAETPRFHDVGMAYWAASNLALFHETAREPEKARQYGETAVRLAEDAAARNPDEPEFSRWTASARERMRRAGRS